MGQNRYLVPSERFFKEHNKMYVVNMTLSLCQCPAGILNGPCKHKQLVADHFNLVSPDIIPHKDPRVRMLYYYLATGEKRDASWFPSLNDVETNEELTSSDVFAFMRNDDSPSGTGGGKAADEILPFIGDDDEPDDVNEDGAVEKTIEGFKDAISQLQEEVITRLTNDHSIAKSVRSFTKHVEASLCKITDAALEKSLFSFLSEQSLPIKKGRRKRDMNIQPSAKSRRVYQMRGSKTARSGRLTKDAAQPKNMKSP